MLDQDDTEVNTRTIWGRDTHGLIDSVAYDPDNYCQGCEKPDRRSQPNDFECPKH
jgi:hypothetical protein